MVLLILLRKSQCLPFHVKYLTRKLLVPFCIVFSTICMSDKVVQPLIMNSLKYLVFRYVHLFHMCI